MNLNKTCALENLAQLIICVRELMHHSKVFLNSLIAVRPGSGWSGAGHTNPKYSDLSPLNNPSNCSQLFYLGGNRKK